MQNRKTCLKHVKPFSQIIKYVVETTIESSKEQFQKNNLRQSFGFLGLRKQTFGPSKKVRQENGLL